MLSYNNILTHLLIQILLKLIMNLALALAMLKEIKALVHLKMMTFSVAVNQFTKEKTF